MSVDGIYQLYRKRTTILGWTSPTSYLYLPTQPAMQLLRGSIYIEDGLTAADFDVAIEVQLQRFTGASYSGGSWSGGAWSTFATLDLYLHYDTSSNTLSGCRWCDELKPEGLFKTMMSAIPDPTKATSLFIANTHAASPVANETDLRIGIEVDPAVGVVSGTEIGVDVMALMGS